MSIRSIKRMRWGGWLALVIGMAAGADAQIPLYWGGGSTDRADGTPLPVTSNGLVGVWNNSTRNWAVDGAGSSYVSFTSSAYGVLGFFNDTPAGVVTRVNIRMDTNVYLNGLLMGFQSPLSGTFNHRFILSNSQPSVINMVGTNFALHVHAQDGTRGLELMSNITFAGSVPLIKHGHGRMNVFARSTNLTGAVELRGGLTLLSDQNGGGYWPAATQVMVRGIASRSATDAGGNSFTWAEFQMIAVSNGVNNQLNDQATVTLTRSTMYYNGRRNNSAAAISSESIRKVVLEPQGFFNLMNAGNGGTYPGTLTLTDAASGLDRGSTGRGTLLVLVTTPGNPTTDVVVANGTSVGGVLPWVVTSRAEFMRLNPLTKALETVSSTAAPTDLSTWVAASDYRVGNNTTFTSSGSLNDLAINSLGFFASDNTTINIAAGKTLTISSGGIAHQPSGALKSTLIRGGYLASGADELVFHGGNDLANHSLFVDSVIAGNGLNVIKAGVGGLNFIGTNANTYSGTTYVNMGNLRLWKTNAISVAGDLSIQRGGAVLLSGVGAQLAGSSAVTIEEDGMFAAADNSHNHAGPLTLNGGTYRVSNSREPIVSASGNGLAFNGGRIEFESGGGRATFSLQSDVSYAASSTRPALWNRYSFSTIQDPGLFTVELDGGNRTFNIADSSALPAAQAEMVFMVPITNGTPAGGSITKTGSGTLQMTMTNYYTGGTIINQGVLHVMRYRADAISGMRASIYNSGAYGSMVALHSPVATNLLIGQSITGTGISARRTVLEVIDPFLIQASGGGGALTDSVNVAFGSIDRSGSLGTGPVTNNGGVLLVDAGITLGNALTLVGGTVTNQGTFTNILTIRGGTLAGTGTNSGPAHLYGGVILGTLHGATTVYGTLSPAGTSTGTLETAGNVSWVGGSSWSSSNDWSFQLGPNNTSDLLRINGNFIKGGGVAFRFDFGGSTSTGTYTLVEWTGSLQDFSADDFDFVNLGGGHSAVFQVVGHQLRAVVSECSALPSITLGSGIAMCSPGSVYATNIHYSATAQSPDRYLLDFNDAANAAGFQDGAEGVLAGAPGSLAFTIPANAPAGTYTGKVVVIISSTGCRNDSSFTVTITAAPAEPGVITQGNPASSTVCVGSSGVTYTVAPVSGASTYTWTVADGNITSGQGTPLITVSWVGASAGNTTVKVKAGNGCATGPERSQNFTLVDSSPGAPAMGTAYDISITSFSFGWTAPMSGGAVEGYRMDVATASDFSTGFVVSNLALSAATTSYTLTGLDGGLTYYVRVRAYNVCGTGANSTALSVLTPLILAAWDANSQPGGSSRYGDSPWTPTAKEGAVTVTGLTHGAGVVTNSGVAPTRAWGGLAWNSTTNTTAISADQYSTFNITPNPGNFVSYYSISKYDYRRDGNGPTHGTLQYSRAGGAYVTLTNIAYSSSSADGGSVSVPIDLSGVADLQNVPETNTVTFRIVNHGAASAAGGWYVYDKGNSTNYDFELRGTICSNPPVVTVTGGGSNCLGGGVAVGLSSSTPGVTYYLYRNGGATLVTNKAGTGGAISFGTQTAADTYTVEAVRNSGGCAASMSGSATVVINELPGTPSNLVAMTSENQVDLSWQAPEAPVTGYLIYRRLASGAYGAALATNQGAGSLAYTDLTAINGNSYYYKVAALNHGCSGSDADEALAVMPSGCATGYPPTMASPGNKTVAINYSLSHAITASEVSEDCPAPTLTHSTLPAWMSFSDNVTGQFRTRTFTSGILTGSEKVGTYPITVTATDTELPPNSTSVTFLVYVGSAGESAYNNTSVRPPSQATWSVGITNLAPVSGSNYDLVWNTTPGVAYDVYTASSFPGASWSVVAGNQITSGTSNLYTVTASGERSYYQVVPRGMNAGTNGVWGVLSLAVPTGFSFYAPPLLTDLDFAGELGDVLAAALPANTYAYIMTPGENAAWTTLLRNNDGDWVHVAGPALSTLQPGQGLFINRLGGSSAPVFSGPVGNTGAEQITLEVGYNLIGLSEGKTLAASSAFESANPYGDASANESLCDQVVIQNSNGTWRRLIRRANGTWYDTANPNSSANTSLTLEPGKAYYYIRRSNNGQGTLTF